MSTTLYFDGSTHSVTLHRLVHLDPFGHIVYSVELDGRPVGTVKRTPSGKSWARAALATAPGRVFYGGAALTRDRAMRALLADLRRAAIAIGTAIRDLADEGASVTSAYAAGLAAEREYAATHPTADDLAAAIGARIDSTEDGWWDVDLTSDGAVVITSGERRAAVASTQPPTAALLACSVADAIIDAVGAIAAIVVTHLDPPRATVTVDRDEYGAVYGESVGGYTFNAISGLDLVVHGANAYGALVSADALYEAAALAAEGFKGDAHRRITRGVPIPTDLRLLADTADLVYDLTNEYFSHPDVVSGAHSAIIGL